MRIGIDCHTVGSQVGGNESYAFHLVRALARIDTRNEYRLYVTKPSPEVTAMMAGAGANLTLVPIRPHHPFIRIPLSLPLELRRHPVDVLLVQYISPPFGRTPVVNMVHDLTVLTQPQFFPKPEVWRQRLLLAPSIRRAARVLTDSEYSRDEIVRLFGTPRERIVVTYLGVSDHFRPVDGAERARVLERFHITTPYILYVGNIQPRKNLSGLVEAFALLKRSEPLPHRLVIVGRKAWHYGDVFARVRALGLEADVLVTAYVPRADLPALYSGAAMFVYPSFAEGFGLPPLEAMQCETPVVASNRPALPEVVGDAAVLMDPAAPADIARAMRAVLHDAGLRATLVARGRARAQLYRWEETARQTLGVFESVSGANAPLRAV